MTIPGRGDLAPLRHQTPLGRWLLTAVVVALLGAGGYFAFVGLSGASTSDQPAAKLDACPATTVPGPTNPHRVHLVVDNGTLRSGLAARVATALKQRGFHVSSIGNAPKLVAGFGAVNYGAGKLRDAQAVADQIRGVRLVSVAGSGISLEIGLRYRALLTKSQASAARNRVVASEAAAHPPTASPTASPTCRPVTAPSH